MCVAIVTGSNKGIGLGIVRALCLKYKGDVYLTSRSQQRGRSAVKLLQREGLEPKYHQMDIDDHDSIVKIRDFIKERYGGINILVNNAGVASKNDVNLLVNIGIPSKNDESECFGTQSAAVVKTNYWGTRNCCDLLFPLLKPGARVVNMSSSAGFLGLIDKWSNIPRSSEPTAAASLKQKLGSSELTIEELDQLMREFVESAMAGKVAERGWIRSPYCASKIAVSALSRVLQRQLDRDPRQDIAVNHAHPGFVSTDMTDGKGIFDIKRGAESGVFGALLPPGTSIKGAYIWHDCQIVDWVNGPTPPGTRASFLNKSKA